MAVKTHREALAGLIDLGSDRLRATLSTLDPIARLAEIGSGVVYTAAPVEVDTLRDVLALLPVNGPAWVAEVRQRLETLAADFELLGKPVLVKTSDQINALRIVADRTVDVTTERTKNIGMDAEPVKFDDSPEALWALIPDFAADRKAIRAMLSQVKR